MRRSLRVIVVGVALAAGITLAVETPAMAATAPGRVTTIAVSVHDEFIGTGTGPTAGLALGAARKDAFDQIHAAGDTACRGFFADSFFDPDADTWVGEVGVLCTVFNG